MRHLGHQLGGPSAADSLIRGEGVSLILKSIDVRFRRPVTYPDTVSTIFWTHRSSVFWNANIGMQLLISHKPIQPELSPNSQQEGVKPPDPAVLLLTSSAFSVTQQAFVAHCSEALVWYDYERLRKCIPGKEYFDAVWEPYLRSSSFAPQNTKP